ncbi:hypothetical protein Ddye_030294 [Dipteronia dyeriana]|uniref:DUF4283 domain-containing protein n=1 Tax=Dipteronia dyeriana TaxID=168575 RepID=A0AAD9TGS9_9ROSI|nr:hypothetical protein Ddye_030294 [Dipteronia dyeriana]
MASAGAKERIKVMKWDEKLQDGSWLDFYAVGVLKAFSDVSPVVYRLYEKKIVVSSVYLGDKHNLWVLNSIKDRDVFIISRLSWEDLFSSVGTWNIAITPHARLSWIEFRGVPVQCWSEEFFMRLGWAVGEPLLIEEEIVNRYLLCRGRVLVLIPYGLRCP